LDHSNQSLGRRELLLVLVVEAIIVRQVPDSKRKLVLIFNVFLKSVNQKVKFGTQLQPHPILALEFSAIQKGNSS